MSLSCYIVDDEAPALDLLQAYIERTPGLRLIGRDTSPLAALQALNTQMPDILFADVDMPEVTGLELVKLIQGRSNVIFTTSYREFGPEAFELRAMDYLLKPFLYERFLQAIQRVHDAHQRNPGHPLNDLYVKTGLKGQLQKVHIPDINYVAGLQAYVEIRHTGGKIITILSLADLLLQLPATQFSRIHKSYIVNLAFIARLEPGQVRLTDDTVLPIGRNYRESFLAKLPQAN